MVPFLTTVVVVSLLPIWILEAAKLRFGVEGQFKILQVADMHYADGKTMPCENVLPVQMAGCSDLNTTAFVKRIIQAEKLDFIVFTGIAFLHFLVIIDVYIVLGKIA